MSGDARSAPVGGAVTDGDPAAGRAGSSRRLVFLGLAEVFALLAVWQLVMGGTSSLGIDYGF